jgi:hypothetical protein
MFYAKTDAFRPAGVRPTECATCGRWESPSSGLCCALRATRPSSGEYCNVSTRNRSTRLHPPRLRLLLSRLLRVLLSFSKRYSSRLNVVLLRFDGRSSLLDCSPETLMVAPQFCTKCIILMPGSVLNTFIAATRSRVGTLWYGPHTLRWFILLLSLALRTFPIIRSFCALFDLSLEFLEISLSGASSSGSRSSLARRA